MVSEKTQIGCSVPVALAEEIKAAATKAGLSVSEWVRLALAAHLRPSQRHPTVPMPQPVKQVLEHTGLAWW